MSRHSAQCPELGLDLCRDFPDSWHPGPWSSFPTGFPNPGRHKSLGPRSDLAKPSAVAALSSQCQAYLPNQHLSQDLPVTQGVSYTSKMALPTSTMRWHGRVPSCSSASLRSPYSPNYTSKLVTLKYLASALSLLVAPKSRCSVSS